MRRVFLALALLLCGVGTAEATAYRYWRAEFSARQDESVSPIGVTDIQFRTSVGGTQAATGGTASASGEFSGSFVAANAFDANNSTHWLSILHTNQYLQYDLGSGNSADMVEVKIYGYATSPAASPKDVTVKGSNDGSSWTTVFSRSSFLTWQSGVPQYASVPGTIGGGKRYWRLLFDGGTQGGGNMTVYEVEMRASVGGATETGTGTASASAGALSGTDIAEQAFDANTATRWGVSGTASTWLKFDFGTAKNIVDVALKSGSTAQTSMPALLKVQSSEDDVTFTTEWHAAPFTFPVSATQSFNNSGGKQWWRAKFTGGTQGSANLSLAELLFRVTPGGATVATGGFAGASTISGNPGNAYDGNAATVFLLAYTSGIWLGYHWSDAKNIVDMAVTAHPSSPTASPATIDVESSPDNETWTLERTCTFATFSAGQTQSCLGALGRTYIIQGANDNFPGWRDAGDRCEIAA